MKPNQVGIYRVQNMDLYEQIERPFDPAENYPELSGRSPVRGASNIVFAGLRDFFRTMGFDSESYGTPEWNPLGWLIQPGHAVMLKPNLVVSEHPQGDRVVRFTDTDGPILRALGEYVLIALKDEGSFTIGDSPIKETDFDRTSEIIGLGAVVESLASRTQADVRLIDIRDFVSERAESAPVAGESQSGDPRGYVQYDLAGRSVLEPVSHLSSKFRSTAAYYENRMGETHGPGVHRYGVSGSLIKADVYLNVPKLKTHCKAGVTAALKNLVGMCNEKRWLPHHRMGKPSDGGDFYQDGAAGSLRLIEGVKDTLQRNSAGRYIYPRIMQANRMLRKVSGIDIRRVVRDSDPYQNGGWHGNDTVWRMVLDLNKILLYGDADGVIHEQPVSRRTFTIVDGLWASEGEGPLVPDPKVGGVILAGHSSPLIDVVGATAMGFDYRKIKMLCEALSQTDLPLAPHGVDELEVVSNVPEWSDLDGLGRNHLDFRPPSGWKGFIEIDGDDESAPVERPSDQGPQQAAP